MKNFASPIALWLAPYTLSVPASSSPSACPSAAAQKTYQQEQHDRAYRGIGNGRTNACAKVNADARQQPIADEGSQNADDDVADEPEPGAPHKLTGQPAGHETHQQDNQQTFIGNVHVRLLLGFKLSTDTVPARSNHSRRILRESSDIANDVLAVAQSDTQMAMIQVRWFV
jgi:hypothetical protein